MPRTDKKAICLICKKSCQSIDSHIISCIDNISIEDTNINYLLKITDDTNLYWMFIIIHCDVKLSSLDTFLRKKWLQCCGHLSEFSINNVKCKFQHKIKQIIQENIVIDYAYDFGTTTNLYITLVKQFNAANNKIKILSQNSSPKYKCSTLEGADGSCKGGSRNCENNFAGSICKKFNSNKICFECNDTYCDHCASSLSHKCDAEDEFLFDLINSPRFADCFYMSRNIYF